jgi:hypothetical protein
MPMEATAKRARVAGPRCRMLLQLRGFIEYSPVGGVMEGVFEEVIGEGSLIEER